MIDHYRPVDLYSSSIVLQDSIGKIIKNRFLTYGGNLEINLNIMLHCCNLKDYYIDDYNLDGVNISIQFAQCNSNAQFIESGLSSTISICNLPITSIASPFFKLQEYIVVPFEFIDIPLTDETKEYKFLPRSITISTINDTTKDVVYNPLQSKYRFKLATNNIKQSFTCKKLYTLKDNT